MPKRAAAASSTVRIGDQSSSDAERGRRAGSRAVRTGPASRSRAAVPITAISLSTAPAGARDRPGRHNETGKQRSFDRERPWQRVLEPVGSALPRSVAA
jgi:hypothetical protein